MPAEKIKLEIIKKIEKHRKEIIEFTRQLVRVKSENPYLPNESWKINQPIEKGVAELIFKRLRGFGLRPRFVSALSNRPNVVCSLKTRGKPSLILNGHTDTVLVTDEKKWKYPPFSAKLVDGRLYGRGSLDMKSSLAAMVFAIKALSDLDLERNLIFTAVVDEEAGACSEIGTKYLLKMGLRGDACIIGEPQTEKIFIGMKGCWRFRLKIKGEAISTGAGVWERRERGMNAVVKMAEILLALEKLELKHKFIKAFQGRKPVITPGTLIKGGAGVNIVPDRCEAVVDVRLMPGQTKEAVKKELLNCIRKLGIKEVKLCDLAFVPPAYISKNEKIVRALEENVDLILGRKPQVSLSPSTCDAHFFINKGIPTICGFGPDGDNFHSPNEFVYTDSIIDVCKIYALTAFDFLR